MVRSYWKGALVLTLACAGAALAQQRSPTPPAPASGRILTVQELGKPAQQCRVLSSRPLPDGNTALEVKCLATGTVSTIIEGPTAGTLKSLPGGLTEPRSGKVVPVSGTQPTLVPTPRAAPVQPAASRPASPYAPPAQTAAVDTRSKAGEIRTVLETGRPPLRCRVARHWRLADGHEACQGQCLETGEMLTLVECGSAPRTGNVSADRGRAMAARIFHWGRYKTSPPGAPVPPGDIVQQATVVAPANQSASVQEPRAGFGGRLKDHVNSLLPGRPRPAPASPYAQQQTGTQQKKPEPTLASAPAQRQTSTEQKKPEPVPISAYAQQQTGTQQKKQPESSPASPYAQRQVGPEHKKPEPIKVAVEAPKPSNARQSWHEPTKPLTASSPGKAMGPAMPPVSALETKPRPDPLTTPENFVSRKVEQRIPSFKAPEDVKVAGTPFLPPSGIQPVAATPDLPKPVTTSPNLPRPATTSPYLPKPVAAAPEVRKAVAAPPALPKPAPAAPDLPKPVAAAPDLRKPTVDVPDMAPEAVIVEGKFPPGAQSVLAASNGLERPVHYIPVPIVTQPERRQPPLPPVPQIPQAPQPNNGLYVNAFTPPQAPMDPQQQEAMQAMMQRGMMPMMPAGGHPAMMGQMQPGMPHTMMAQRPMGYGYPAANAGYPGMYPQPPYGMVGPMMMPGRGTVPTTYQGPLPPNPFAVMPVGYNTPGYPQMAAKTALVNPAMDRRAPVHEPVGMTANQAAAAAAIQEMLQVLKTSTYPSQREWAANNLATFDGQSHPEVVYALLTAAKGDPAPTVRAGCAYSLSRMQATAEPVLATLQQLKSDTDPRVRLEAEKALARLAPPATPGTGSNAVQPVRAVNP